MKIQISILCFVFIFFFSLNIVKGYWIIGLTPKIYINITKCKIYKVPNKFGEKSYEDMTLIYDVDYIDGNIVLISKIGDEYNSISRIYYDANGIITEIAIFDFKGTCRERITFERSGIEHVNDAYVSNRTKTYSFKYSYFGNYILNQAELKSINKITDKVFTQSFEYGWTQIGANGKKKISIQRYNIDTTANNSFRIYQNSDGTIKEIDFLALGEIVYSYLFIYY